MHEEAVGVVFDDGETVAADGVDDLAPAAWRHRDAGRVVERRLNHQHASPARARDGVERVGTQAFGVDRDGHGLQPQHARRGDHAGVGELLDEDGIAR
jgi:hypothetical protein